MVELEVELEICGHLLTVVIGAEASRTDFSIGAYEFWGSRGSHHEWGWEVEYADVSYDLADVQVFPELRHWSRRRRRKWLRQQRRKVGRLIEAEAERYFEDHQDDFIEAAECQCPEPDYAY